MPTLRLSTLLRYDNSHVGKVRSSYRVHGPSAKREINLEQAANSKSLHVESMATLNVTVSQKRPQTDDAETHKTHVALSSVRPLLGTVCGRLS
jgi:hypothetical protein